MRRILVTGGCGQLAQAIHVKATSTDYYDIVSHAELDITDSEALERYAVEHDIDTIVNCAAYTNVEGAEEHPEAAYAINHEAVEAMVEVCRRHTIKLIHISTDYVFGGDSERNTPYTEADITAPINIYGESKARGEREVLSLPTAVVIRTSWLYAPWGKNFVLTIRRIATEQKEISVVSDQRGTPTSALGLAEAIVTMITSGAIETMSGIYHYSDHGEASWYDFAREIIRQSGIDCSVVPTTSAERKMRAQRPAYSVLSNSRIAEIEGVSILPWQERLCEVIDLMNK